MNKGYLYINNSGSIIRVTKIKYIMQQWRDQRLNIQKHLSSDKEINKAALGDRILKRHH